MKLADLMMEVDRFVDKYALSPAALDKEHKARMKSDLLDLIQKSVDHGEGKDQNKITGIATGILKQFLPFGKKD